MLLKSKSQSILDNEAIANFSSAQKAVEIILNQARHEIDRHSAYLAVQVTLTRTIAADHLVAGLFDGELWLSRPIFNVPKGKPERAG